MLLSGSVLYRRSKGNAIGLLGGLPVLLCG